MVRELVESSVRMAMTRSGSRSQVASVIRKARDRPLALAGYQMAAVQIARTIPVMATTIAKYPRSVGRTTSAASGRGVCSRAVCSQAVHCRA